MDTKVYWPSVHNDSIGEAILQENKYPFCKFGYKWLEVGWTNITTHVSENQNQYNHIPDQLCLVYLLCMYDHLFVFVSDKHPLCK